MKTILITGASSGVGAASAKNFAQNGAKVILVARSAQKLTDLANEIGERAVAEPCDAANPVAVQKLAERVAAQHGAPDVIVNGAGAGQWKSVQDTTPQEAVSMMQAPYFAAFNVTHAFLPAMLERGHGTIIHLNSPACLAAWPNSAGYAAARSALLGFHRALAQDLVGTGVHSCHVIFGKIASDYFANNPGVEEQMPTLTRTIPTLSVQDCATALQKVVSRPRGSAIFPWVLRIHCGAAMVLPGLSARLLRL